MTQQKYEDYTQTIAKAAGELFLLNQFHPLLRFLAGVANETWENEKLQSEFISEFGQGVGDFFAAIAAYARALVKACEELRNPATN